MPPTFQIIAHRGACTLAPENTREAFEAAIYAGFHHIELDVQLTADGVCVVLHDEQLGRTVPGDGPVAGISWDQLRQLDAGSWFNAEEVTLSALRAAKGATAAEAFSSQGDATPQRLDQWSGCRVPLFEDVLREYGMKTHLHVVSQRLLPPVRRAQLQQAHTTLTRCKLRPRVVRQKAVGSIFCVLANYGWNTRRTC